MNCTLLWNRNVIQTSPLTKIVQYYHPTQPELPSNVMKMWLQHQDHVVFDGIVDDMINA